MYFLKKPLIQNSGIDAIATNATIAQAITDQGADYLLAVKANQPTLRAEIEAAFGEANGLETHVTHDKGHGRIEQRSISVLREINWMDGPRRFPGEMRLPAPCVREVVRCSIYLYFSGGRIRTMTWDIHWTEKQLC